MRKKQDTQDLAEAVDQVVAEHPRDEDGKFSAGVTDAAEEPAETPESIHYREIVKLTAVVQDAGWKLHLAKDEASALKKDYDRLTEQLLTLISRGPDWQRRLPFSEDQPAVSSEAYREVPIAELGLPAGLNDKLDGEGLSTLGALQDFWRAGKYLTELNGIGSEKAAIIADAFADYGAKHPELFGGPAAETSADDTDTEEDPAENA